ncbi:MAG TPA: 3-dehydro-L-gulonate 2-dehydrogenase [Candidatus Ventrimonas merdavium]|nr:3-dehydro-L-gulonate 2-dehydrogenase [Candidatus Ventrimonas merdavium]
MRIPYETMVSEFKRVLLKYGFDEARAQDAAEIFAQNSLAGVYSHGLNRFPRVVAYLQKGLIDPKAEATCELSFGAFERWNGHRGFGPLNARAAMDRAVELAKQFGIGLVALGNNNHWMRGGSYGWQAADQGCIGICWSNTCPNMPAWGGVDPRLGNNPLVLAIPRSNGEHVVIDCAISQFSYGKLETCRLNGQSLPVPGGYDTQGNLTADPAQIEQTRRMLPMGYWKGSGISIALDLIATVLTNGNPVHTIGTFEDEVGLTQIMIAIDPGKANSPELTDEIVDGIIADVKSSIPEKEGGQVYYPGENALRNRKENLELGIPAAEEKWNQVLAM